MLVTNDDGITSPGLLALRNEFAAFADVVVVAPDAERSAAGHAITVLTPLRVKDFFVGELHAGYQVSGTPADCVKLALGSLLADPPDLVVSGVNLGSNTATNVIYSGTVSAATEARILGVPSLAVSIHANRHPHWETATAWARRVGLMILERGLPDRVLLNVNVPNLPPEQIRGCRVTRQGDSSWLQRYDRREDPRSVPYYWAAGTYQMSDEDPDTDAHAVADGHVSVTPITFDLTAHDALAAVREWRLES